MDDEIKIIDVSGQNAPLDYAGIEKEGFHQQNEGGDFAQIEGEEVLKRASVAAAQFVARFK